MNTISPRLLSSALTLVASLAACNASETKSPVSDATDPQNPKPTIVLVHGAFADASSWNGVIERLEKRGYTVLAPPNLLRGPEPDGVALASVLKTINGPIVLAGHSYGGIVISRAAQDNPAVKALVFVSAFIPDTGDSVVSMTEKFAPTKFGPNVLKQVPYVPACGGTGMDVYLKPESFHEVFAPDVTESTARVMASTQRPIEGSAIPAKLVGTPAWKNVPSWALVSRQDQMISPDAERFMAQRAKAHVVEVDASHAVAVSQPNAVTDLIVEAAHSVK